MTQTIAFKFNARYDISIDCDYTAILSLPSASSVKPALQEKNLLATGNVGVDHKYTLEQHLACLKASGKITTGRPLLVFGARNLCVNLRSPAILDGKCYAVQGDDITKSDRPYYGIGLRKSHNKLSCDVLSGCKTIPNVTTPADWDFFCAGIPVLWDDLDNKQLLDLMLCEASDHSHLFNLPRGNHPAATDTTRAAWQMLHTTYKSHLHSRLSEAATAMRTTLEDILHDIPNLTRCNDYVHAIMGVTDNGVIVYLVALGLLEDLGKIMRQYGCKRAVCLENSGSVMPTFLPSGVDGDIIPLLRAPNFRPFGRAVIAIELPKNAAFSSDQVTGGADYPVQEDKATRLLTALGLGSDDNAPDLISDINAW